ncbi:hypothetical protein IWX50DRAFT_634564 [Phyllosticta citricarpa]
MASSSSGPGPSLPWLRTRLGLLTRLWFLVCLSVCLSTSLLCSALLWPSRRTPVGRGCMRLRCGCCAMHEMAPLACHRCLSPPSYIRYALVLPEICACLPATCLPTCLH